MHRLSVGKNLRRSLLLGATLLLLASCSGGGSGGGSSPVGGSAVSSGTGTGSSDPGTGGSGGSGASDSGSTTDSGSGDDTSNGGGTTASGTGSGGSSSSGGGSSSSDGGGSSSGGGGTSASGGSSGAGSSSGGGATTGGGTTAGGGSSGGSSAGGSTAGGGSSTGGGTGGGTTGPFAVTNPYALPGASSVQDVRVKRAIVFGDSYSVRNPLQPFDPWPTKLRDQGLFARLDNYARGGTTADDSRYRSFKDEVDNFEAADGSFRKGDLTVVYLGYNDINTGRDLDQSKTVMRRELERLRSLGAIAGDRRMFLMLLHDWSRNPGGKPFQRAQVRDWNGYLANYANGRSRVIAVDLFTLIERVFANPGRFGFTNVTTADPANSDSTALYYDDLHFGPAGQKLIAGLVEHYLTRGWDWANSLNAGSASSARLEQDIDNGLLNALALLGSDDRETRFFAFSVGAEGTADAGPNAAFALPFDQQSTAFRTETIERGGAGLAWRLSPRTTLAIAFARNGETVEQSHDDVDQRASVLSDGFGLELRTARGGLQFRSHALWTRDTHEQRFYDSAFRESSRALAEGTSWSIGQTISWPHRLAFGTLTPWGDITLRRQSIDGYSLADPYLGEIRFGDAQAYESLASFGLSLNSDPVLLKEGGALTFGASFGYTRSLSQEDWRVEITEGLVTREETVARSPTGRIEAGAEMRLELGDALALSATYNASHDAMAGTDHYLFGSLRYAF